jgi:hypothetical protein
MAFFNPECTSDITNATPLKAFARSSTLRVEDKVQVVLHDDGKQGRVDSVAGLRQDGKKAPCRSFRPDSSTSPAVVANVFRASAVVVGAALERGRHR